MHARGTRRRLALTGSALAGPDLSPGPGSLPGRFKRERIRADSPEQGARCQEADGILQIMSGFWASREAESGKAAAPAGCAEQATGSFLALGTLRALLAVDEAGAEREAGPLLAVLAGHLLVPAVGMLSADDLGWTASVGFPPGVQELVTRDADGEAAGSLARRVLEERKILLLGRGSHDPRLMRLRELRRELQVMALVPLRSAGRDVGVLVLAAPDAKILAAPVLASLRSVFSLLAVLVEPRGDAATPEEPAIAPVEEEIEAELEELRRRNREAEAALQRARESASSAGAAGRVELEAARARVAELEADVVRIEADRRDGEDQAAHVAEIEEKLRETLSRGAELEEEIERLRETIALLESEVCEFEDSAPAEGSLVQDDESGQEFSLEETAIEGLELGAIAAKAAAVLDVTDGAGSGEVEALPLDLEVDEAVDVVDAHAALAEACAAGEGEPTPRDLPLEAILDGGPPEEPLDPARAAVDDEPRTLWLADPEAESFAMAEELAAPLGFEVHRPDENSRGAPGFVAVNLLEAGLGGFFGLLRTQAAASSGLAYGRADGMGFELGEVGWLPRPLDPAAIVECLSRKDGAPRSVLLVSGHLRELAPLREALGAAGIGGSVACDSRQALDLLEIVQRPDAVVIDLDLEGCQGLGLAARLRGAMETESLPIHLVVPATPDPARMQRDAEAAGLLGSFGEADLRRLLASGMRAAG